MACQFKAHMYCRKLVMQLVMNWGGLSFQVKVHLNGLLYRVTDSFRGRAPLLPEIRCSFALARTMAKQSSFTSPVIPCLVAAFTTPMRTTTHQMACCLPV